MQKDGEDDPLLSAYSMKREILNNLFPELIEKNIEFNIDYSADQASVMITPKIADMGISPNEATALMFSNQ